MLNKDRPIYLKTFTLRNIKDVPGIQSDIKKQMILIIRITPLANKNADELKMAVDDLYKTVDEQGGDIARLGEERIIITPPVVKIWHNDHTGINNDK
jgi:SepF-like predicted cell division protein (DUF552 family)